MVFGGNLVFATLTQATLYPGLCEPTSQGGLGFDYFINLSASEMWLWFLENVPDHEWSMTKVTEHVYHSLWHLENSFGFTLMRY